MPFLSEHVQNTPAFLLVFRTPNLPNSSKCQMLTFHLLKVFHLSKIFIKSSIILFQNEVSHLSFKLPTTRNDQRHFFAILICCKLESFSRQTVKNWGEEEEEERVVSFPVLISQHAQLAVQRLKPLR